MEEYNKDEDCWQYNGKPYVQFRACKYVKNSAQGHGGAFNFFVWKFPPPPYCIYSNNKGLDDNLPANIYAYANCL